VDFELGVFAVAGRRELEERTAGPFGGDQCIDTSVLAAKAQPRPALADVDGDQRSLAELTRSGSSSRTLLGGEGASNGYHGRNLRAPGGLVWMGPAIVHLEPRFKSRPLVEEATLTIGQLAAAVGLNASAVRYYERRGVMPVPERTSGQRRYRAEAISRLRTIQAAQQVGLSLSEITQLLAGADNGESAEVLRELAERRLPDVEALIERAQAMKGWLELAAECRCASLDICDLFASDGLSHAGRAVRVSLPGTR
jgi:MerR family transcriptional regulator, redox-sensitive transcriptional activator SoxR